MKSINAYATKYDPANAYWLGRAARLVYEKDPHLMASKTAEWGFDKFCFLDIEETQAFITRKQDAIVIVFRGTTNLKDWMTNIKTILVPGPGGKVHRGFLAGFNCVWNELKEKVSEFQDCNQPILITGHSLGAALATIAAMTFKENNFPVNGIYTFGSPRVGDHTFVEAFNAAFPTQAFRFVNNNDVVTRVAPRAMLYGHVGRFLYFDVLGNLKDNLCYWNRFLETIKGGMEDFLKLQVNCIRDHRMTIYEQFLLKNIDHYLEIT